jgi:hypothetical protein
MRKNKLLLLMGISMLIAFLYKLIKIGIIISFFYIIPLLGIHNRTVLYILDSAIRFLSVFILLFFVYRNLRKWIPNYSVWFFAFFIFFFIVVQLFFNIFSFFLFGSQLDLGAILPDIELVPPAALFFYYYFIKKDKIA